MEISNNIAQYMRYMYMVLLDENKVNHYCFVKHFGLSD